MTSAEAEQPVGLIAGTVGRSVPTCRGLVSAGEEEEGVLPTASDEGQAEPWDSSLWCCSGDRLSLLLSSSNA